MEKLKISVCTVCMNRLHHLRQTLLDNILDNSNYERVEFILLDYNSTDGLEQYIRSEMIEYIRSGKLIYYKIKTPQYFNRSHSRNLAFRLAKGDILCNIDADNFTGKQFTEYVNSTFAANTGIFLTGMQNGDFNDSSDVLGKICVRKEDFNKVKGYDERMKNYGFEDYDLVNRLRIAGLSGISISADRDFLKVIKHTHLERVSNEVITHSLKMLLLSYINPSSSDIIFLFNNGTFSQGTIIDNFTYKHRRPISEFRKTQLKYQYSLLQTGWLNGLWTENNSDVFFYSKQRLVNRLRVDKDIKCFVSVMKSVGRNYYNVSNPNLKQQAIMFYSQVSNRMIMDRSKLLDKQVVNKTFGRGVVFKNFNDDEPYNIS